MSSFRINDMHEYSRWSDGTNYGYDMKNTIVRFHNHPLTYNWTYHQWLFNEDIG